MHEELERAAAQLDAAVLGRRIKEARRAAGLTQPELAEPDASAAYLSRIERGQRRPSPALLDRLCARLGLSVELIVLGVEEPDPREVECQVGFAELDLHTGVADQALQRAELLLSEHADRLPAPLRHRLELVMGSAHAALGDMPAAASAFQAILSVSPPTDVYAAAALRLTRLLREGGDLKGSIATGEAALTQLRSQAAPPADELIRLAVTTAAAYWEGGDVARALSICRQAIAESEASGSPAARGAAYWNTAIIESEAGNLDEALSLTRRALTMFETESDLRLYARLRTQLAELLVRTDPPQTDEAFDLLEDAKRALAFTSADAVEVMHNRMAFARAYFAAGDLDSAEQEAGAAIDDETAQPFVSATAATLLGRIALERNDHVQARKRFVRAVAFLSQAGADRRVAQLWFSLASALDEIGLDAEAKDAYRRAAASTGLAATFGATRVSVN